MRLFLYRNKVVIKLFLLNLPLFILNPSLLILYHQCVLTSALDPAFGSCIVPFLLSFSL